MKDIRACVFKEFLKYVYFGKIELKTRDYYSLNYLAKIFQQPTLEKILIKKINNMSIEDAAEKLEVLEVSIECNFNDLKSVVLQFIGKNFSDVLKSDSLMRVNEETFVEILQIDKVCHKFATEMEVVNAVVKYCQSSAYTKYSDVVLKCIRFPTLTVKEFVELNGNNILPLTVKEKFQILLEICGGPKTTFGYSTKKRLRDNVITSDTMEVILWKLLKWTSTPLRLLNMVSFQLTKPYFKQIHQLLLLMFIWGAFPIAVSWSYVF